MRNRLELRLFLIASALLLCLPAGGCFDPQYGEGGFHCTPTEGADACPDGYTCQNGPEAGEFLCKLPVETFVEIHVLDTPVKPGDKMRIKLVVEGHKLAPEKLGQAAVPGEGHVHVFIDTIDTLNHTWTTVTTLDAEIQIPTTLEAGVHDVIAVLANNDHSLVSPRVQDEAEFEVVP